jgi:hypothetical protein
LNVYNCCDDVTKSADLFALRHTNAEYLTVESGSNFLGVRLRPGAASEEHRKEFTRQDDLVTHCANTIQCWWKVWSTMKEQRLRRQQELVAKSEVAICLQSRIRGRQGQKNAHEMHRAKVAFAEGMQRKFRLRKKRQRRAKAINMWKSRVLYTTTAAWKGYTRDCVAAKGQASYQVLCKKALGYWRNKALHNIMTSWSSYALPRQAKMKAAMRFWRNHVIIKFWPTWRGKAQAHKARRKKIADMSLVVLPLNTWNSTHHQTMMQTADEAAQLFFKRFVAVRIFSALRQFVAMQKDFLKKAMLRILIPSAGGWVIRTWRAYADQQILDRTVTPLPPSPRALGIHAWCILNAKERS